MPLLRFLRFPLSTMRGLPCRFQFYGRIISHPAAALRESIQHSLRASLASIHSSPLVQNGRQSLHGNELPTRSNPNPMTFRRYVFSPDYLLRGLYRSLLIAVFAIPLIILWEGPMDLNHTDEEWEPFDLIHRHDLGNNHSIFTLKRRIPKKYFWGWYTPEIPEAMTVASRTPIMSVRIKNPSLQIQRSYTPLSLSSEAIQILVKRYPGGELSRFLHFLTPGVATVWVNQGRQEWTYKEGEWDHIIFIAGGTGITPAFQLCFTALQRQQNHMQNDPSTRKTRFSVLAAAGNEQSILLRKDFDAISKMYGNGRLDVKYFVDNVPKGTKLPEDIYPGPITEKLIVETIYPSKGWLTWRQPKAVSSENEKVMVLVCGPDGFTKYISGEHGGVASNQGVKGGLLQNVEGIELFKLLESRDVDFPEESRKPPRGIPVMKME